MPELGLIATALSLAKQTFAGLRSLRQADLSAAHKDTVENALDRVTDLMGIIGDVQAESITLRDENARLRKQIGESDTWNERAEGYESIGTEGGGRVLQSVAKGEYGT